MKRCEDNIFYRICFVRGRIAQFRKQWCCIKEVGSREEACVPFSAEYLRINSFILVMSPVESSSIDRIGW
jgi:hypothetical protein